MSDWELRPSTRRSSRDCVDIVSPTDGHIATYVWRRWGEQIVADHNDVERLRQENERLRRASGAMSETS